jgi:HEAT repeat protein
LLTGLSGAVIVGYAIYESIGIVVAMLLYGMLIGMGTIFWSAMKAPRWSPNGSKLLESRNLLNFIEVIVDGAEELTERVMLSSVLFQVLAAINCLPIRFHRFCAYAVDALLLKRSAGDIEFMHRLLRDYFALRDLQPMLGSKESARRLQAIRNLGFQGDAAIAPLAEYVRDLNEETREAAAWAFGRIASPEIVQHLRHALSDRSKVVRAAATLSSRNISQEDRDALLTIVLDDQELVVQRALIQVVLELGAFGWYRLEHSMNERVWEEMLSDSDEVTGKVLANIRDRAELQDIVAEFIAGEFDYRCSMAAIALTGAVRNRNGVPVLINVLLGRQSQLRVGAANALGNIGDHRAEKALIRASKARNRALRSAAYRALGRLQA